MRKTLSSLVIALMLGWSGAAIAGNYQKGWEAYRAGDYGTALTEFRELAEQKLTFLPLYCAATIGDVSIKAFY